jgi:hypothetical protein
MQSDISGNESNLVHCGTPMGQPHTHSFNAPKALLAMRLICNQETGSSILSRSTNLGKWRNGRRTGFRFQRRNT